jgi:hypothetical protein
MLSRLKFNIDPLVDQMLSSLPESIFISKTTTFLDPSMGGGQFIKGLQARLRAYGHSERNIRQRIYGIEIYPHRLTYGVNAYKLEGQFEVTDFLTKDFKDMRFDVIIGNPPYQLPNAKTSGGANTLWKQFIKKVITLVAKDGYVGLVTPSIPYYNKGVIGDFFTKKQTETVWTDISQHFPGVGSAFTAWIVKNAPHSYPTTVVDLQRTVDLSKRKYRNILSQTADDILDKIIRAESTLGVHDVRQDSDLNNRNLKDTPDTLFNYRVRWGSPKVDKSTSLSNFYRYSDIPSFCHDKCKVMCSFSGNPHWRYFDCTDSVSSFANMSGYLLVNNQTEGLNFIEQMNLSVNKFKRKNTASTGAFTGTHFYRNIKFDLTTTITDADTYAILGLTPTEIDYIESSNL